MASKRFPAAVEALVVELQALAGRVAALERRFDATRPQDDAALIVALASSIGGRVFTARR